MEGATRLPALARPGGFAGRLALIAAAALAIRVLFTLLVSNDVKGIGDYFFFHFAANNLADGEGYDWPFHFAAGQRSGPTAEHPPLWPALLSLASLLGATSEPAHKLVGCLAGTGTVVAVGVLGRHVGGGRTGLAAAGIAAAYPLFIAGDASLMSESLYGFLVALSLVTAYRLLERPSAPRAAALGAAVALAALTCSEALLLLPLLVLPVAWRAPATLGARGRLAGAAVLAALVVVAPWTVRNWIEFDRPVLVSTNDGAVLAGANCDAVYRGPDIGMWSFECASRATDPNEAVQSARRRRAGLEYARDHAGRLPAVVGVRLLRTWDLYQPRRGVRFTEGRRTWAQELGVATFLLAVLPLAVAGAVILRRGGEPLLILLAPVALVVVASAIGYGTSRFRHAAEIPLVVLAAVAAVWLRDRVAERSRRRSASPPSATAASTTMAGSAATRKRVEP
jgi:4-amino-4-deoxy-L-arabinose transferase-like glycosyltransferase